MSDREKIAKGLEKGELTLDPEEAQEAIVMTVEMMGDRPRQPGTLESTCFYCDTPVIFGPDSAGLQLMCFHCWKDGVHLRPKH